MCTVYPGNDYFLFKVCDIVQGAWPVTHQHPILPWAGPQWCEKPSTSLSGGDVWGAVEERGTASLCRTFSERFPYCPFKDNTPTHAPPRQQGVSLRGPTFHVDLSSVSSWVPSCVIRQNSSSESVIIKGVSHLALVHTTWSLRFSYINSSYQLQIPGPQVPGKRHLPMQPSKGNSVSSITFQAIF